MAKQTRWEEGFDAGAVACIVTMLRMDGWNVSETARELLHDFNPSPKKISEDDLEVLREYKLVN